MKTIFPFLRELDQRGSLDQVRADLRVGLTLAFLAVPQCMAYAIIAGLHPSYGLYAGVVTAIVASLFMSSRHVVTGPTATVSLIVAGIVLGIDLPPHETVIYLSVMVGLFQVLYYMLGIGNLARFVSDAVVNGFVTGSAVVIIGSQLFKLLNASGVQSAYFIVRAYYSIRSLVQDPTIINGLSLGIGVGTVVVLAILRRLSGRFPSSLVLMLMGALGVWYFGLHRQGIEVAGEIPGIIPTLTLPTSENIGVLEQLISGAIALSLFCSIQCVSVAKSIASRTQDSLNPNKELLGQGVANVFTGLLSGYPAGASFSRSFLNVSLGGRTQLSAIFCGGFVSILIAVGSTVLFYVPLPVLAGVIIVVVSEVIDFEQLKTIWITTIQDRVAFLTTFLGVIFLQLDLAIYLGVAVSLVFYLREATRLDLKEYIINESGELVHITSADQRLDPHITVIDVNGEVFFGAADQITKRIRNFMEESDELDVVILRMKNVTNFDITAANVIRNIFRELQDREKTLFLCGTTPKIREVLQESMIADEIGEDKILVAQKNLLESTKSALERAQEHIDNVIEGHLEPEEEEPKLKDTLEELSENPEDDVDQEPIEEEKATVDEEPREMDEDS